MQLSKQFLKGAAQHAASHFLAEMLQINTHVSCKPTVLWMDGFPRMHGLSMGLSGGERGVKRGVDRYGCRLQSRLHLGHLVRLAQFALGELVLQVWHDPAANTGTSR